MRKAKQSATKNVMVLMVDSTDHITGKAGLTLTITASKNGGAFASISPDVTERGNGWYSLALTASHTDTLGDLALHVTGASADPADLVLLVEAGATDADVSTRLATADYTAPDNSSITAILADTAEIGTAGAGLSALASAALLTSVAGYIDTEVSAIKTKTDALPASPAGTEDIPSAAGIATQVRSELAAELARIDVTVSSRLATAGYTAPDNASIATILSTGFGDIDRTLLEAIEQDALGARTLDLGTGQETISRTGRSDKVRTLYKDAAKTLPVSSEEDPVLGTGEAA